MASSRRNTRYALADLTGSNVNYNPTTNKTALTMAFTTGKVALVLPNDETRLLNSIASRLPAFKPLG